MCQDDFSSQNILFKLWKYGLILPKFEYNPSKKVFEYKKSYIRYLNWMILLILGYLLMEFNKSILESPVIVFVVTTYNWLLFLNTCFNIFVIFFAVGTIEKMSENVKNISLLTKTIGSYGNIKRQRIDVTWLIYVGFLYIFMFVCTAFFYLIDMNFIAMVRLAVHVCYMLNIESQELLICYKSSIVYHLQQFNTLLENGNSKLENMKEYKLLIDECKRTVCDFKSVSSYLVLVKCFYVAYSCIVSLFMHMDFAAQNPYSFSFVLSCLTNILWFSIEVCTLSLVVSQDDAIHKEVR